jgi:hypothetical protein
MFADLPMSAGAATGARIVHSGRSGYMSASTTNYWLQSDSGPQVAVEPRK